MRTTLRRTATSTLPIALCAALTATGCGKRRAADRPASATADETSRPDGHPTLGVATGPKLEVLAFIDYECPFCRVNVAKLGAALAQHGKVMRVRFYNLPLGVHPHSVILAKAALAARAQGRWRSFYEQVLGGSAEKAGPADKAGPAKKAGPRKGRVYDRDALIAWAATAGLDGKEFAAALDDPKIAAEIAADVALANALGVTGTPSFIVNGALLQGAQSPEDWAKIVAGQVAQWDSLAKAPGDQGEQAGSEQAGSKQAGSERAGSKQAGSKKARTWADLHWAMVQKNSPERAPVYKKYVLDGEPAPAAPVPAKVKRKSRIVSAEIQPAGSAMGGVRIGQPVRIGEEAGDPATVWRVAIRPDDPRRGSDKAPVTMVIFEDFQCPFCKGLQATLKNVMAKVGEDKLRLVFKHNPLPFHKQAMEAAEAAEAARAQGRFWELHDLLFAHQDKLAIGTRKLAEQAGLDLAQYDNAMTSHGARARIQADMEQAAALGARGTPNIFVNGRKLVGAKDADTLLAAIDKAAREAEELLKGGAVKAEDYYEHAIGEGKLLDSLGSETVSIDTRDAPTRGPKGAAIHIVAFEDFQCPFSARLDPHIRVIEKEFPGRVKVTWMDFPLHKIHAEAQVAAEVGREAQAQGKFWEYHAAVMADQRDLTAPALTAVAKKIGMDVKKLDKHMKANKWHEVIARRRGVGEKLGVKGTPTVYINGHKFVPQLGFSANTFRTAITRILGTRS